MGHGLHKLEGYATLIYATLKRHKLEGYATRTAQTKSLWDSQTPQNTLTQIFAKNWTYPKIN